MNAQSKRLTIKRWVLLTTLGWLFGILLIVGFALIGEFLIKMSHEYGGQTVVGIGMGAGVGFMQWMAIRKYVAASSGLFLYSVIGFSFAFFMLDVITAQIEMRTVTETTIPFAVFLGAFISAWLQYKFILKKVSESAKGWIIYSIIGWLLATLITMGTSLFNFKFGGHLPVIFIVLFAIIMLSIGGPILGYITGRFMVPLINLSEKKEPGD